MMQNVLFSPNYVIDTNCFIEGINEIYNPDIFPVLWAEIGRLISNHEILLIQEVIGELEQKMDDASEWVSSYKSNYKAFSKDQGRFQKVENEFSRLRAKHANRKTSDVDLWVIAWAKIMDAKVITQEKMGGGSHKIPSICNEPDVNVKCISLAGLMSEKGWKFK